MKLMKSLDKIGAFRLIPRKRTGFRQPVLLGPIVIKGNGNWACINGLPLLIGLRLIISPVLGVRMIHNRRVKA